MQGIDAYRRPFLVIKCEIDGNKIMQTFFQRYANNTQFWMGCGHATHCYLMHTDDGMNRSQFQFLIDLVQGKKLTLQHKHIPYIDDLIGKRIIMYNEKEIKAAKIIQYHWRLCRYNPKYKMCEQVQLHGYEDLYEEQNKNLN